ncbi:MAG: hypothetical protein QXD13_01215 [Candidatus Pacearchaeota archaeon]
MKLKELKEKYDVVAKKYKLPNFEELNADFEIENIRKESDILLRVVRKVMMTKVTNFMNFIEMIQNPVNAPRFYFAYIKAMSSEDKRELEKIYGELADIYLEALGLEIEYDEKGEAEMTSKIYKSWISIKPRFKKIIADIKGAGSATNAKEKTYFG